MIMLGNIIGLELILSVAVIALTLYWLFIFSSKKKEMSDQHDSASCLPEVETSSPELSAAHPKEEIRSTTTVLLVFPKKFEFTNFMVEVACTMFCNSTKFQLPDGESFWTRLLLGDERGGFPYSVHCFVACATGLEFQKKLDEFVVEQSKTNRGNYSLIILVGTAMGSAEEHLVGNAYVVTEAVRGEDFGTYESQKFYSTFGKRLLSAPPTIEVTNAAHEYRSVVSISDEKIISTQLTLFNKLHSCNVLGDMETYWFYETCAKLAIPSFFAVRVVSDQLWDMNAELLQWIRLTTHFDGANALVFQYLQSIWFNGSYNFLDRNITVHNNKDILKIFQTKHKLDMKTIKKRLLNCTDEHTKEVLNHAVQQSNEYMRTLEDIVKQRFCP